MLLGARRGTGAHQLPGAAEGWSFCTVPWSARVAEERQLVVDAFSSPCERTQRPASTIRAHATLVDPHWHDNSDSPSRLC